MVDLVGNGFELNLETLEHMGITYPIWIMEYYLLQPFPKEQSRLTNIFKPFSGIVSFKYFLK